MSVGPLVKPMKKTDERIPQVEGSVRARDLQGGDGVSYFLSETLFSWDGHGTAPHEFNFQTLMGTFIPPVQERRLLPPSFSARLSHIIPGLNVSVRYEFVVSVMRNAGPLEFWKRRTRYVSCCGARGAAVLMIPSIDYEFLLHSSP